VDINIHFVYLCKVTEQIYIKKALEPITYIREMEDKIFIEAYNAFETSKIRSIREEMMSEYGRVHEQYFM
jgi:hypothetical protein